MFKILKTFYKFNTQNMGVFLLFLLTIVISSASRNSIPYVYKLFIEKITSGNLEGVIYILLLFVGIRVISSLIESSSYFVGDLLLKETAADTRSKIFRHVQNLDFYFHTNKSTGSLISIFKRGDGAFFNLFHHLHYKIIDVLIGFVIMLFFLANVDIYIGIAATVSFFVLLILSKPIVKKNIDARMKFNDEEDKVSAVITDNLLAYETVKLFAREDWEYKKLNSLFINWKKRLWDYGISFRYFDITVTAVINSSIFIILYLGLVSFDAGRIVLGDLILIVGFIDIFFPRVFEIVWGFREIAKNYSDIEKYFYLLDEQIEVKDPASPKTIKRLKGEIEFDNIDFGYKGGKDSAIKNLNLTIRQGQSVALVGRSGSGKTTIIKLLFRFYDPSKGNITIDGINIRDINKTHLRSLIGIVPQEPILFNNTILYNLTYPKPSASMEEVIAASKIANIYEFIESLPDKYKTNVGERGIKLSGGQKQRLAIARMIIANPKIIVFDEATSQLDSESENLIQEAFWKVARNKTTIIIAHRLSTVMKTDKIVVMDNGTKIEEGTHMTLTHKKESLYKLLWDLQTQSVKK